MALWVLLATHLASVDVAVSGSRCCEWATSYKLMVSRRFLYGTAHVIVLVF